MSIIWQQTSGADCYQVRRAGNSIRLYRNGVLHTQYNPLRPIGGNLWDLLMIPAFFYKPGSIRRVLVLGVGGGGVIRLLNQFVRPERIFGIELNPIHIKIARRFFGIGSRQATLVHADAVRWVREYRGAAFDLIVDDIFNEESGEPKRAVLADSDWFHRLQRHLSPEGMLVMNYATRTELKKCAYFHDPAIAQQYGSAFRLNMPQYENTVAAFLAARSTSRQLRRHLKLEPGLNPDVKSTRLTYQIRQL